MRNKAFGRRSCALPKDDKHPQHQHMDEERLFQDLHQLVVPSASCPPVAAARAAIMEMEAGRAALPTAPAEGLWAEVARVGGAMAEAVEEAAQRGCGVGGGGDGG